MPENTEKEPCDMDHMGPGETLYTRPESLIRDQDNRGWLWLDRRVSREPSGDLCLAVRMASDVRICWFTEREHFIAGWPRQSIEPLIEEQTLALAILLERPWDEYEPAALSERIHELVNQRNVYWPRVTAKDASDTPPVCDGCGAVKVLAYCDMCDGEGEVSECESEGGDPDNIWPCNWCDGTGLTWWCERTNWRGEHRPRASDETVN